MVLITKAPKFQKKLPRALSKEAAKEISQSIDLTDNEPWVIARDTAVILLLYGCGLRISEALSLKYSEMPLTDTLKIHGISLYFKLSASEIRRPQPYSNNITAVSLAITHGSLSVKSILCEISLAASFESARGNFF
jgi:hypothetical protein